MMGQAKGLEKGKTRGLSKLKPSQLPLDNAVVFIRQKKRAPMT